MGMIRLWRLRLLALMLVCLQSSCKKIQDARFAEIVALNRSSPSDFSLRTVEFVEPPTLPQLENDKMRVVAGAKLDQIALGREANLVSSFAMLYDSLHRNMNHEPFRLDVVTEDGVARARTFESILALTAFSHFERLFAFAETNHCAYHFNRPLTLALYGEINNGDSPAHNVSKRDNVLFVGVADTVFLLPLGKEDGLPLSMHEGVLAHEFHHRIFWRAVWEHPAFSNLWSLYQSRYKPGGTKLDTRSRVLLNALDEGLADVFAIAYTGLPDYLSISLTEDATENLRKQRDLNGDFALAVTYEMLAKAELPQAFLSMCGEQSDNFTNLKFNVYCLGTVVAKVLYDASGGNANTLRLAILPHIVPSLAAIAATLNQGKSIDLDIFFDVLVRRVGTTSTVVRQRLCEEIRHRFSTLATTERLPACAEFLFH